ncbi:hypothetical protein DNU06_05750 [Putridiphycobacter roseus]|uniref:Multidrug resistance protein MdtA-like barrel-sandwich hybrid domain-containing protein n=1 Tax=Putridiphycobacter roseus TaxID=2219161 RepID=A0A2W1N0M0_9FLAO|nr:efflux RND transporter periplasmic adaptor subunit [Putridiphycobacter roseus]PZE18119.1 hypothetical protein DNU06_05750 [Putridiphycobacter roseus]
MKRIISILIIIGLFALVVVKLAANKTEAKSRIYHYDKEAYIPVFGQIVSKKSQTETKSYTGLFEAIEEVKLSADLQGKIIAIYVKEGQQVKKGQALLKIDDAMLKLQLAVLKSKIAGVKKDEARFKNLTASDAVPAINLEKTQNMLETLAAEQNTILEQLSKTTLKAPFDGVISMKFCEKGGFASPAIPLFEIINLQALKFTIHVPEEEINYFTKNNIYHIQTSAKKTCPGELRQVSSKGGLGNSFKVEFSVETTDFIKPNMIGEISFTPENTNQDALRISATAIIGSELNPTIYVVKNRQAIRTPIVITARNGNFISFTGEVAVGDTIITGGFINIDDNANVQVNL